VQSIPAVSEHPHPAHDFVLGLTPGLEALSVQPLTHQRAEQDLAILTISMPLTKRGRLNIPGLCT
jgi:hypothetical protein